MAHSRRTSRTLILAITTAGTLFVTACEPYRVEYRRRPEFYKRMMDDAPDRVVLDDGTVIVYSANPQARNMSAAAIATAARRDAEADPDDIFKIRDVDEDGTVTLRALMPEHVIANTLNCLRTQEYELIWDQLLAEQTKLAYKAEELGKDEFIAFFRTHRKELAKTLNRMRLGFISHETVVNRTPDGVIECSFWPQIATQFRFRKVLIVRENFGLKLLMIR